MRYVIASMALWILAAGCFASADPYTANTQEEQKDERYETEGNTIRYESPEVMLEATYLSDGGLDLYFSKFKGGRFKNPVPAGPYKAFSLTIENRTDGATLSFNPGLAMLHARTVKPNPAKDYTSFYTDLEFMQLPDVEARMEAYKAACFDRMATVEPGGRMQGLLVFEKPDDLKDSARLVVDGLYVGSKARTVFFSFETGLDAP